MIVEAVTFAAASAVHFNITLGLGLFSIQGEPFRGAAIPEAIIAAVLVVGVIAWILIPRAGRMLALGSTAFAIVGVLIGLSFIIPTAASRPGDLTYHLGVLAALILTVALQRIGNAV